jgi:RimJ/RimL family protein N-acetyltransferase
LAHNLKTFLDLFSKKPDLYASARPLYPDEPFEAALIPHWGPPESVREVVMPLHFLAGRHAYRRVWTWAKGKMIIVETARLVLRHFRISDLEAMLILFGDAEVMRYGDGAQSPQWVRSWLRRRLDEAHQHSGIGPWAVIEKASSETIGYCGLFYFPDINGQAETEIGYRLARPFWGRGYATEAARAVRDYAFSTLGISRLITIIDPHNVASIRVAEKIGMRYEQDVIFDGYTHPDHVYAIELPKGGKQGARAGLMCGAA